MEIVVGAPLRDVALILFIVLACALSLTGVLTPEPQAQQRETSVTVTRVVDGDTVEISPAIGGKTDVRLIGVDTSETVETSTEIQPYGPQASQFTKRELQSQKVTLEFDQDRKTGTTDCWPM